MMHIIRPMTMNPLDRHLHQPDTILVLTAPGASQEEIMRGIAAVWDAFHAIDVHPYAAAQAAFEQENFADSHGMEDDDKFPLSEENLQWAELWRNAGAIAMEACGRK
ncbi:MAG: hypothetical protein Q7K57_19480 [Burkholderiaceae bacterium]|nr:hypothetical protein [Burkholderiaceae bacterium]